MNMIKRAIKDDIIGKLKTTRKIVIIYGARQVGKTTLADQIIADLGMKTLRINADEIKYRDILSSQDLEKMRSLVSGYELLFIDEAQRIENIGLNLKILADGLQDLKIMVTGSSSFDLANKIKEPLTGRTWTYELYPISCHELSKTQNEFELKNKLDELLVFGGYPEVYTTTGIFDKKRLLGEIASSYLYKDILELENIKRSEKVIKLLKLLAFQIGNEVSIHELSLNLEMSSEAVRRYIDLLEKSYVIFSLSALSKNPRKEIAKKEKIYFYDIGVRNVIIDDFRYLSERNDQGALFENFLVSERKKRNGYIQKSVTSYFWRAYTGSEIDYIEQEGEKYFTYEFKFRKDKARLSKKFTDSYGETELKVINKENFLEFVI